MLERAEKIRHVDSVQPPLSLINRKAAADVIPWALLHGTGVIVYSPMQSGLLTGSFTRDRVQQLAEDDWRRRSPNFLEPALSKNLALVDALKPIADRREATVAEIAIAWVLTRPGVTAGIVGARSPQQVDGWIKAPLRELTADDLVEVARAIEKTGAGEGPVEQEI